MNSICIQCGLRKRYSGAGRFVYGLKQGYVRGQITLDAMEDVMESKRLQFISFAYGSVCRYK